MWWQKLATSSKRPKLLRKSKLRIARLLLRGQFLRIIGDSMNPTLRPGQIVFVNTRAFRRRAPRRGEVVVARPHSAGGRLMVKRLAALPCDTMELDGQQWQLQEHEFFLLGDHARVSTDSRRFGPVSRRELVGPIQFRVWPPSWNPA